MTKLSICLALFALVLMGSPAQTSNIAAVSSGDNRFEVFIQTTHGIQHYWQVAPNSDLFQHATPYLPGSITQAGEIDYSGTRRNTIVAARDASGRLTVAWIADGQVFVNSAPGAGASLPSSGTALPSSGGTFALAIGMDHGDLVIVTLKRSGSVSSYRDFVSPQGIKWHLPQNWPTPFPLLQISVANHIDGRLALIGLGANPQTSMSNKGNFVIAMDLAPNGSGNFGPPRFVPCTNVASVTAAESSDHRLEVFALGADGLVYNVNEPSPGATFTSWALLSTNRTGYPGVGGPPLVMSLANGLNLVAPVSAQGLGLLTQSTPNGGWNGTWSQLQQAHDNPLPNYSGSRGSAVRPDGVAAVFYVGSAVFPGAAAPAPQGIPIRYTHGAYDGSITKWPKSIPLDTVPE